MPFAQVSIFLHSIFALLTLAIVIVLPSSSVSAHCPSLDHGLSAVLAGNPKVVFLFNFHYHLIALSRHLFEVPCCTEVIQLPPSMLQSLVSTSISEVSNSTCPMGQKSSMGLARRPTDLTPNPGSIASDWPCISSAVCCSS